MALVLLKNITTPKKPLIPSNSDYLSDNVLLYLSKPMQAFCEQQLKEFEDPNTLKEIAHHTIWWENFNSKNPTFFLNEMTNYHYKEWHLKNLILGSVFISVFDDKNIVTQSSLNTYKEVVLEYPNSSTSKIIERYLVLLGKNNFKRSQEIDQFFNNL